MDSTSPVSGALESVKLELKSTIRQFQAQFQFLPLPSQPTPGSAAQIAMFLKIIYTIHSKLRYCFQCIHMGSPTLSAIEDIVPSSPALDRLIAKIASSLQEPSCLSSMELTSMGVLHDEDNIMTFLTMVYNTFLQYPPSSRPAYSHATTETIRESVLGWSSVSRSSLPLFEAASLLQMRSGDFLNASVAFANHSLILNAMTVSPRQGQLEWLALVADTLVGSVSEENGLEWQKIATSQLSGALLGSQSLVMNEIMMTEATIDKPNELFELLNPAFFVGRAAELTYNLRRRLALQRLEPGSTSLAQPAAAARALIRHIRSALVCTDIDKRKRLYEKWIQSEWDVPSILFDVSEIRQILKHLDHEDVMELVLSHTIQNLILRHRGLKAVCARARSLAHKCFKGLDLAAPPSQAFSQNSQLQFHAIFKARFFPRDNRTGQVLEGTRVVGTDASKVQQPRRLWDLIFNTTIESDYTSLPWVAVSHSWSQADGYCLCMINGRANIIPWCTKADLNNVREAMLQTGITLGWMDKICLRQRGIQGFDGALRTLEWCTDIPFIDVAYRFASKIIVYIDGAGRDIQYRGTFREGSSWLYRKWTAQETPRGVEIVLAAGDHCLDGDFFANCQDILGCWHQKNHKSNELWQEKCQLCEGVWKRISAVKALRDLGNEVPDEDNLKHVSDVMKQRVAGCAADHVFSLISLLGVTNRPRYDPRYTIEQATSLVKEHLSLQYRQILESTEHMALFDGIFSTATISSARWINTELAAFKSTSIPSSNEITGEFYELHGIISRKQRVSQVVNGRVSSLLEEQQSRQCLCEQLPKPLDLDNRDIYSDFFVWHGTEACCAAISDIEATEGDKDALRRATHLILSENRLCCVLLEISRPAEQSTMYSVVGRERSMIFNSAPQWTATRKGQEIGSLMVRHKEE